MQLFIDHDPQCHYFTLRGQYPEDFRRICLFDLLANNADRKAGHTILGPDGRIWGIDHGLTFNADPKLRTVIWDFVGEPIPKELLPDVESLYKDLEAGRGVTPALRELLLPEELDAFKQRVKGVLSRPVYPPQPAYRATPWPWL
jgi:uncharacterized repeat protein (TIGR03843 family)